MKMIGVTTRVCDSKCCTCNEGQTKNRRRQVRTAKRRERAMWKKGAPDWR